MPKDIEVTNDHFYDDCHHRSWCSDVCYINIKSGCVDTKIIFRGIITCLAMKFIFCHILTSIYLQVLCDRPP